MLETNGLDIFDQIEIADAICITTNCSIYEFCGKKINPMGALAGAAAKIWENIPYIYADLLLKSGAVPVILGYIEKNNKNLIEYNKEHNNFNDISDKNKYTALVAFPTMYEIGIAADLKLIERGAGLLYEMADRLNFNKVYLAAPGIGVGGLNYSVVSKVLEKYLDDRFTVMRK